MKSIYTALILLISISASALQISLDCATFRDAGQSYVETYIRVLSSTLTFKEDLQGLSSAAVDLTLIISKGDEIVSFEKYTLTAAKLQTISDLIDVKRFALPAGNYKLRLEALDQLDAENKVELVQSFTVENASVGVSMSDVQIFADVMQAAVTDPLAKNGIYMEPLSFRIVTEDLSTLHIYTEVYGVLDMEKVFLRYSIRGLDQNAESDPLMKKVQPVKLSTSAKVLSSLPVDKLPSGQYKLTVELIDRDLVVLDEREVAFVRENSTYDREYWESYNDSQANSFVSDMSDGEIDYALRATSPIVYEPKKSLMNYMVGEASLPAKKQYLFQIWKDKHPNNTEYHFLQYLTFAKAVDLEYNSNVGYGFETDRGYIFLRYGKPNNVLAIDQEPDSYPYEIWYYHNMSETSQTNVRFLFYNKSLVHNDYTLLHSTCRLERFNPDWELELYRKALDTQGASPTDGDTVGDGWDRMAKRYFDEF